MPDKVGVFVSHHHSPEEDKFTARLVGDLRAASADVWVDNDEIRSDSFIQKINEGLADKDWFVLVMTPDALHSKWVLREVDAALVRVNNGLMRSIIPVMAKACDKADIPPLLEPFQRYNATHNYKRALTGLLCALELSALGIAIPSSPVSPASPLSKVGPRAQSEWVVDASGSGDYHTISEAIRTAAPRDRIVVRPGTFQDGLVIDKSLELVGEGDRDVIIIEGKDTLGKLGVRISGLPAIQVRATGVRLSNVSVRMRQWQLLTSRGDAVVVENNGELSIVECDVSSSKGGGSGVWIKSGKVTIRSSEIHDCGRCGVVLEGEQAKAVLEESAIHNCGVFPETLLYAPYAPAPPDAAVHIKSRATFAAHGNRITHNDGCAIQIDAGARGTIEDNDLRDNKRGAWKIANSRTTQVIRSRNLE